MGFYATEYTVFSYQIPDTRIVIIDEIGYEMSRTVPIGHAFKVRVRRDGETMAEWEDQVITNAANPNERYVFGSIARPVPVNLRVDKNQWLTVTVEILGPYPFTKTAADPFNHNFKALVYGVMDRLRDTRDGGYKPVVVPSDRGADFNALKYDTARVLGAWPRAGLYFATRFDPVESNEPYREIVEPVFHE